MGRPFGFDLEGPSLLHYSCRQDALIWAPERVAS